MQLTLFSIYDSKAEAYIAPFYCPNTAVAIRSFRTAAEQEGHAFNQNPGDYTLFEMGTFEDGTGQHKITKAKKNLGTALELKRDLGYQAEQTVQQLREAFPVKGGE